MSGLSIVQVLTEKYCQFQSTNQNEDHYEYSWLWKFTWKVSYFEIQGFEVISKYHITFDHMLPQSRDLKSWFWPKCFLSKLEIFRSGVTYRWGRRSEKENPERFDFAEAHSGLRLMRLVMTQNWPFFHSETTQKYQQTNKYHQHDAKWLLNGIFT